MTAVFLHILFSYSYFEWFHTVLWLIYKIKFKILTIHTLWKKNVHYREHESILRKMKNEIKKKTVYNIHANQFIYDYLAILKLMFDWNKKNEWEMKWKEYSITYTWIMYVPLASMRKILILIKEREKGNIF